MQLCLYSDLFAWVMMFLPTLDIFINVIRLNRAHRKAVLSDLLYIPSITSRRFWVPRHIWSIYYDRIMKINIAHQRHVRWIGSSSVLVDLRIGALSHPPHPICTMPARELAALELPYLPLTDQKSFPLNNLRYCSFTDCRGFEPHPGWFTDVCRQLSTSPRLTTVRLRSITGDQILTSICPEGRVYRCVQYLKIEHMIRWGHDLWARLAISFPKLRVMRLIGCMLLDDHSIRFAVGHIQSTYWKQLRVLEIAGTLITNDGLAMLLRHATELTRLRLTYNHHMNSAKLGHLIYSLCPKLAHLELDVPLSSSFHSLRSTCVVRTIST